MVQLNPPSTITAVALNSSWNILAIGCLHGYVMVDMISRTVIHTKFTYTPSIVTKAVSSISSELI